MEPDEIDARLGRYEAAAERIAANLVELDDHPTYSLISSDTLVGVTRQRLAGAVAEAPALWHGLDALRSTLATARQIRDEGRMNSDRRTRLAALLDGPSVLLETLETPLAERDLLGRGQRERRVTIDELLGLLRKTYEPLRDGVAAIDAVWRDVLPRVDAADTTLGELDAELAELGAAEPSVGRARDQLDDLRGAVMDDPLGLPADAGSSLDDAVREAARRVGDLRRGNAELGADLARTEELVAEARLLRARAAAGHSESTAKIVEPDLGRAPAASFIDDLATRARELRGATGPWQPIRVRLDAWLAHAERLVTQLRKVEARNQRPLEQREQLRGLLTAYRAKAAAIGRIEDPDVMDLADDAHAELYTSPTDLARAQALVAALAGAMNDGVEPGEGSAP